MSGIDPSMMQSIMQMMQAQRADPFSQALPGQGLLGDGAMASPMGAMQGMQDPQMGMQMPGMDMGGMQGNPGMMQAPTDFADTQPGLPNLPNSFGGFGFGQFAPEEFQPMGIRQQYITQMLDMLPGIQIGADQGAMPGMGFGSLGGPGRMGRR